MINNNPYNLPDRMPQKQTRIYTETGPSHYRQDSIENIPIFNQPTSRAMQPNLIMKRSTINVDQAPNSYRSPTYYPTVKNEVKHYLQSPKNPNTSSCGNLNNLAHHVGVSDNSKSQIKEMRESFGRALDVHQINQKIQVLSLAIKNNQKRILDLQRSACPSNILPNLSRLSELHPEPSEVTKNEIYHQIVGKYEQQCSQNIKNLRHDILTVRQQMKTCLKNNDIDRLITQKVKQFKSGKIDLKDLHEGHSDRALKQIESIRSQLEERMKKNHDFMLAIVARLEKQVQHNLVSPPYKSSGIRCTGTAILLRFVESFKVRKNNSNNMAKPNGQTKITILDNTYYIDSEGYLLDKDQYYLVDSRGMQVKLDEKHIRLLKDENVL